MRLLVLLWLVSLSGVSGASGLLEPYVGAVLSDRQSGAEPAVHEVVLGSLKKVNQVLRPEASDVILGRKSSETYALPQARHTDEVSAYYRQLAETEGELVFSCKGRACGSSATEAFAFVGRGFAFSAR